MMVILKIFIIFQADLLAADVESHSILSLGHGRLKTTYADAIA